MTKNEIAKYIDQTLLRACATEDEIKSFCQNAKNYHFASVCVNPQFVPLCAEILKDSDVKVCTVIDFLWAAVVYLISRTRLTGQFVTVPVNLILS